MNDPACIAYGHGTAAGVRAVIHEDILRDTRLRFPGADTFRHRLSSLLTPHVIAVTTHRIAHLLWVRGWKRVALVLSRLNLLWHKVMITPDSCIGPGLYLPHPPGVAFGGRAGSNLTLYSLAICWPLELRHAFETGPRLGDRITIGAHALILGPITVGSDSKVAYSVRLDSDAAPQSLVVSRSLRLAFRSTASVPEPVQ